MKSIVCGAGVVGTSIAEKLSQEGLDVTVIDQSPDLIKKISEKLDVKAIVGHGSSPTVLKKAGADDCDILIAVTQTDEVNMIACQIAQIFFEIPTKIARIRQQDYLNSNWSTMFDNLHIDTKISPEVEVALICEPFPSSKEFLLSTTISLILIHLGRCLIRCFTFLTKLAAVLSFVAITKTFLSRWKSISHAM